MSRKGLLIRNKHTERKVSAELREDSKPPKTPNEIWSVDFLSDQLFDSSKIRILTIVDVFSKLTPAIDVRQRYCGIEVVDTRHSRALHRERRAEPFRGGRLAQVSKNLSKYGLDVRQFVPTF